MLILYNSFILLNYYYFIKYLKINLCYIRNILLFNNLISNFIILIAKSKEISNK